jgi:hypothetical protein
LDVASLLSALQITHFVPNVQQLQEQSLYLKIVRPCARIVVVQKRFEVHFYPDHHPVTKINKKK